MDFYVGQEVVCVAEFDGLSYPSERTPIVGGIYTIRSLDLDYIPGELFIRLAEIVNPVLVYADGVAERQYNAAKFRPVQRRELPASLTHLLSQPIEREVADA